MKRLILFFIMFLIIALSAGLNPGGATDISNTEAPYITLATTTSTENSGLLGYLHPHFTDATGISLRVISKGTGAALKIARNGDADVVMVHSRKAEEKFVTDGFGVKRYPLMHNDFVILGPTKDPAGAKGKNIRDALKLISDTKAPFISRGDNSGTHNKEILLWGEAKLTPPCHEWYFAVGQGMGKTMMVASEKQAYTLADRGTYLAMMKNIELVVISEGSELLMNPYSGVFTQKSKNQGHHNE